MRGIKFAAVVLLASALPLSAFAQSTSSSNVSSLLAQLSALEQEIQSVSGGATAAPASAPTVNASASGTSCLDLTRTLSVGSSGADVVQLQNFLAQQGFFGVSATGYFGTVTQSGVALWQEKNGVVSGGSASTTGLGVVGPRTRAAMAAACGGPTTTSVSSTQCLPVAAPQAECSTGWKPVTDANGCAIYYQCIIALPTAPTSTPSSSSGSTGATTSCPVVQQPECIGQVEPFETNSNGCVVSYQCVL
jgi:peptidoglycan hydrolase-like protein with peptidoglycan-binding domain